MKFFINSLEGTFLERPNRFIVWADTNKGKIRAHCPNPGRLLELLIPGRRIILEKGAAPGRKTEYTLVGVYYKNKVVPLYSARANNIVSNLVIPQLFTGVQKVIPEKTIDSSRFDFFITTKTDSIFLEVKACTLVENGIAMFPDAPTVRGKRHVDELAALPKKYGGRYKGHIVFLIADPDCRHFVPNIHTDPAFSRALQSAEKNTTIHAVSSRTFPDGTMEIVRTDIPVHYGPVDWTIKDTGSYLLIIHIKEEKNLQIGSLGILCFHKGYYCYIGSALQHLHHRMKRHLKKKKPSHWHIDYLTKEGNVVSSFPIYNPVRQECNIALEIKTIADFEMRGFGSSDCSCRSHLYYFKDNPKYLEPFVNVLFIFRHSPQLTMETW